MALLMDGLYICLCGLSAVQTKDKLKTLKIISATMRLNLEIIQRANQNKEGTLKFSNE